MDRQRGRADAAFGAEEGENLSGILRAGNVGRPAMVEPGKRVREFVGVEGFAKKFTVPGSHGPQQQVRIGGGRERQDRDLVVKTLAQKFSGLERQLRVPSKSTTAMQAWASIARWVRAGSLVVEK